MTITRVAGSATSSSSSVGRIIDVTAAPYNAVGNNSTLNDAAISSAIAALAPGDTLLVPPGIFRTNSVLALNKPGVIMRGGGELRATAEATSAFKIQGNHCVIEDITFSCPTTTQRWTAPEQHKLVLDACVGTTIRRVTIDGSAGAGFYAEGASYYHVDGCLVKNTRADAYHNVGASHHGLITNCDALNVGDDGYAVVSYVSTGVTHHIRVADCKVTTVTGGRLFSVIGSTDVEMSGCYGDGSYGAGLIVATEPSFDTPSVARVLMRNMEVRNANTVVGAGGRPDHGGILVDSAKDGTAITDVTFRNIRIRDTDTGVASRNIAILKSGTATMSGVVLEDVKVEGGPATLVAATAASTEYRLTDVKGSGSWGWELLGSAKLTGSAASTSVVTVPARDELMIVGKVHGFSAADIPAFRFNADTGNNYWSRFLTSAAGGTTLTNVATTTTDRARVSGVSVQSVKQFCLRIANSTGWQKTISIDAATATGAAGSSGALDVAGAAEWVNTTAQITSVQMLTAGGATMGQDSGFLVFGRNLS